MKERMMKRRKKISDDEVKGDNDNEVDGKGGFLSK